METETGTEDKSIGGFPIKDRSVENAEGIARTLNAIDSLEDLQSEFEKQGIESEEIADIQSTLSDRRIGNKISDERKQALDRIEEYTFFKKRLPNTRDPEDTTAKRESGIGTLNLGRRTMTDVEKKDSSKN